jgi:hypothetical protein
LDNSDMALGKSLTYKRKSTGPSIDHWGTATVTHSH